MFILSTVESILYFIGKIQTTLNCTYNLLLTIGHVILLVIIEVFKLLNKIFWTSSDVFEILKEDFEVFKHDILALFSPGLKWIEDSTIKVFVCAQKSYSFLLSVFKGFSTYMSVFFNFYQHLYWGVDKSLILFLDSLCLIGNTIIYCLSCTINLCSMDTLTQLSSILYCNFIHIIRLEAIIGLVTLVFFTLISIKCKIHLKFFNMINILFFKFVISSHHGLKLFLTIMSFLLSEIYKKWSSVKYVFYKYVRKKEVSKLNQDDLQKLLEEEKAEKLCVICMDRKRNIILLHCQHLILCDICVSTVLQENALCPDYKGTLIKKCSNMIFPKPMDRGRPMWNIKFIWIKQNKENNQRCYYVPHI